MIRPITCVKIMLVDKFPYSGNGEEEMTRIAKIALINSENDLTIEALETAAQAYDFIGNTVKRDLSRRLIGKIEKAVKKYDENNKPIIKDLVKKDV